MDMTMDGYEEEPVKTEEITDERRYAGFWIRFWAYIVDVIIIFSVKGLFLSPLAFLNDGVPYEIGFWTLNGILGGIIYFAYFALMTRYFQQTAGKMIFGLKVISTDNKKPVWSDIFFREVVGRFIYNLFTVLKLLYIIVGFTKYKQGIHDYIGNTYVIYERG